MSMDPDFMATMMKHHEAVFGKGASGTLVMIDHETMVPAMYGVGARGVTDTVALLTAMFAAYRLNLQILAANLGVTEEMLKEAVEQIGWPAFEKNVESNARVIPTSSLPKTQ